VHQGHPVHQQFPHACPIIPNRLHLRPYIGVRLHQLLRDLALRYDQSTILIWKKVLRGWTSLAWIQSSWRGWTRVCRWRASERMSGPSCAAALADRLSSTPHISRAASSKAETPVYQHRQRPDPPVVPTPPRSAPPQQPQHRPEHVTPKQITTNVVSVPPQNEVKPTRSSGSSSTIQEDPKVAPPRVGGFASNTNVRFRISWKYSY
jgi:hypothetical protein